MYKAGLGDFALRRAVREMAAGLVDADLGGGLFKKRVPISGRGKRGGARVIVATRTQARWFFIYGFGKNERSDIAPAELRALRGIAEALRDLGQRRLEAAVRVGELVEVDDAEDEA